MATRRNVEVATAAFTAYFQNRLVGGNLDPLTRRRPAPSLRALPRHEPEPGLRQTEAHPRTWAPPPMRMGVGHNKVNRLHGVL